VSFPDMNRGTIVVCRRRANRPKLAAMLAPAPSVLRLAALFCLAEIGAMTGVMFFPALLPTFQAAWGLGNADAGWIAGIYYVGYAGAAPVLVALTDRIDARRIYVAGSLLSALASAGFATAEGLVSASVWRLLAGIGFAGCYMPGLKALSDRIDTTAGSRAVAFYTAASGVGTALSILLSGWLEGLAGWQSAALLLALGPAAGGLLVLDAVPARAPATAGAGSLLSALDFRPVLRNRPSVGYMLAYAAHSWELFGFRAWLVAFLAFVAAAGGGEGGPGPATVATLVVLAGVPATLFGNEGAIRYGRRRAIVAYATVSAALGLCLGFAAEGPYLPVALLCLLYGTLNLLDSSALTAGQVAAARPHERGVTLAAHSFMGFIVAFPAPMGVGLALDLFGRNPLGWGLGLGTLGLVAASVPLWLHLFRVDEGPKA